MTTTYCINCRAVISRGTTCCPHCGSVWRAEAIPAPDDGSTAADREAAHEAMSWPVRTAGGLAADAHVISARIVGHVRQLRRLAHVRDRVRKEAVAREAESLACIARDLDQWTKAAEEFSQDLAARGGA